YVSSNQTSFTPPNRSDYAYVTYVPWWWGGSTESHSVPPMEFKGPTDSGARTIEAADSTMEKQCLAADGKPGM
ncbi:MAG: hypothetical protein ACKOSQ_03755, partial [Planctomycetaceae bacterium]